MAREVQSEWDLEQTSNEVNREVTHGVIQNEHPRETVLSGGW